LWAALLGQLLAKALRLYTVPAIRPETPGRFELWAVNRA
jgi:hypothetical protein